MGMTDDFEASLQVLRGFDTDISAEVNDIKKSVASSKKKGMISIGELKRRRYWFPLTIGIGLLMFQQLNGINGVLFYSTNIFKSAGGCNSRNDTSCFCSTIRATWGLHFALAWAVPNEYMIDVTVKISIQPFSPALSFGKAATRFHMSFLVKTPYRIEHEAKPPKSVKMYVFAGPSPQSVVQKYTHLVGLPAAIPYWSLGKIVGYTE